MPIMDDKMMKTKAISFSTNPRCLLKITHVQSPRAVTLADGIQLRPGDMLVGAHLWNEHLPPKEGTGLSSHLAQMRGSLRELAQAVQSRPDFQDARAIYGEVGFISDARLAEARRLAGRLGFELQTGEQPRWNPFRRSFWRNAISWWLLRKFNPSSLKEIGFGRMRRCELWMSREELLARYGGS